MEATKRLGEMPDSKVSVKATQRRFGRAEIFQILAETKRVAGTERYLICPEAKKFTGRRLPFGKNARVSGLKMSDDNPY